MSFADLPVSARLAHALTLGALAPPLAADVDAPPDVLALLAPHALRWQQLDGNLQRLLLWDSGYVLGAGRLARVFVRCGLAMDDAPLPRAPLEQRGCATRRCSAPSSEEDVWQAAACADSLVAQVARCAVLAPALEVAPTSPLWSQEANNSDIPRPRISRHSATTYAIHLHDAGDGDGRAEVCSTHLRISVPCTAYETGADWCAPKPSGRVDALLADLRRRIAAASSTARDGATALGGVPVAVWIAAAALSVLTVALCAVARLRVRRIRRHVATALADQKLSEVVELPAVESAGDHFLARSTTASSALFALTPVLGVPQPLHLTGITSANANGLAKSASYSDLISSSDVMMAFQCDPVVLAKRVPMVDLAFEALIAQGASGEIRAGRMHGRSAPVALKQVLRVRMNDPREIEKFALEIQLHVTLAHPNVVRVLGVAWTSFQNLVLVMEHAPGGDLLRALRHRGRRWTWTGEKLRVAHGVVRALAYLHGLQTPVMHRDVKSRNILVDEATSEPQLCDLGAACSVDNLRVDFAATDPAGTILWSAPEVITAQRYTEKADVYSFGVVLTELDTCKLPYKDEKDSTGRQVQAIRIARMVANDEIRPALMPESPAFVRSIARACLQHDPARRPSARELARYLADPGERGRFDWAAAEDGTRDLVKRETTRGALFCL